MQQGSQVQWYLIHFLNGVFPYATAAVGISLISFTPLGRAAVSWLKGHINRGRAAELAGEIDRLQSELDQVQERLDFAERRLVGPGTPARNSPREVTPAG
jgi:hypothetical protein